MTKPSEAFAATVEDDGGAPVVVVVGELDMATAPELAQVLHVLVEEESPALVLDFSRLTFLDSSGIAVLIEAQQRLAQQERQLSIRSVPSSAMKVFEISGLLEFLQVEADMATDTPSS